MKTWNIFRSSGDGRIKPGRANNKTSPPTKEAATKQSPTRGTTRNKKMKKEEMIAELDTVLGKANVKIVDICGDKKPVEDAVITLEHGKDSVVVRSGMNIVQEITDSEVFGLLKKTKRAIWSIVDKTRDEVFGKSEPEKAEKSEKKGKFDGKMLNGKAFDELMEKVNDLLVVANEKLENMVKDSGSFPYGIDDVRMTVYADEAGIYLRSGRTPVCAVIRAGSKEGLLREIKSAVWSEVDATRSAIERRKSIKADADALEDESKKRDKAAAALVAAGLSADILGAGCDPEAAKAIVDAARKAVKSVNKKIKYLYFPNALDAVCGGKKKAELVVKGFSGGIVILADGKPCLVSRFPKIGNNRTVEKTVAFIEADISALGESRREYFRMVQKKFEFEDSLRVVSKDIATANGQLMAMAAM